MAVLDAGGVNAQQARLLFDVALTEVFFLRRVRVAECTAFPMSS